MAGFGAKVKLTVDRSSKAEFNKQINDLVGQIKISNKFTVLQKDMDRVRREAQAMLNSNPMTLKVNKIDCSAAVTNVKKQLQTMLSSLSVTNGVNITGLKDFLGTEGVEATMRSTADAADAAVQKMNEAKKAAADWAGQMSVLDTVVRGVASAYKSGISGKNMIADEAEIQRITAAYNEWIKKVQEVKSTQTGDIGALQQEGLAIQRNITALQNKQVEEAKAAAAAERAAVAAEQAAQKEEAANQSEIASLKQISNLQERMTRFLRANSKLTFTETGSSIRAMITELSSGVEITTDRFREMEGEFAKIRAEVTTTGSLGRSVLDGLSKAYEKFGGWMLVTRSLVAAIRTLKSMVSNVKDLNDALTQLQIVTGATDVQLTSFLSNATKLAKDLGKEITDILSSIETFSRLGYDLMDATKLAEYANILSNVAAVDTETATTGMTSIIKGFNMDVAQAEHVADVLIEVGQKYAVSASEMIEAYEKSGAALNASNTSFEKAAGLIAAANASVQNASTVGTALKTISARIRGATSELEDLGESTEDLVQGFSKYAKEIKALTGFDIMVDGTTDTYKDIYDIFEGIAKVWDKLSDTQQARVAEILGGTRQLQVISSILGNWSDAAGAYADAMASAGTATEANTIYMDSISGRLGVLNASFQEFSNTLINSNMVKFFVDLGTAIINVLNALEKMHLLLPVITSVIVAIIAVRKTITSFSTINTIVENLVVEKAATDTLTAAVAKLNEVEKQRLVLKIQNAVASETLNATEAQQILTTLGLAAAEGTLTGANNLLSISFETLKASIPVWGVIAIGVTALISAITWLTNSFKSNEEQLADLNDEYETLSSTIRNLSSEFRSLKSSADEVIPRFVELASGVDKFGKNVSLTDEEYAEFLKLNNRIAEMFPELNLGMDSNGNAMLALSYSADTLTESLNALVEAQRNAANQQIADTMPDVLSNIRSTTAIYEDEIKELESVKEKYASFYQSYLNKSLQTTFNVGSEASAKALREYLEMAAELGIAVDEKLYASANSRSVKHTLTWDYSAIDNEELLRRIEQQYGIALEKTDKLINDYAARIQAKWAQINPVVNSWMQTDFMFQDLEDQMQNIAEVMVSGLDFGSLGLKTEQEVQDYIDRYIVEPLFLATPEVKDAFASITDWQSELKSGEIMFDEFSKRVKGAFDGLLDSMDDDQARKFKENFVSGFKAFGIEGNNFDSVVKGLIETWGSATSTISGHLSSLNDLSETLEDLKKSYDLISTAQEEMDSDKGLSSDTIKALAAIEKNYLDYLYEENGVVKLNTEAWKERSRAVAESDIATLQAEVDRLVEQGIVIRENLRHYEEMRDLAAEEGNWLWVASWNIQIKASIDALRENNEELAECENRLKIVSAAYESFLNPTVDVWDFSSLVNSLNDVESSVGDIVDAMDSLKNGTALTVEELSKLALKYPELLKASNLFTDTSISNQQSLLDSVLSTYEAEYDALIDTKIAELTATNEMIRKQIELENEKKNKVVEIADLQVNGQLDSEEEYQKLLNELRDLEGKNFVTYSDGILDVNQDLLENMLEQQGEKVDDSKPIWGALGSMIIEGHSKGLTGALKTFPDYLTRLKNWANGSLKSILTGIGTNIGNAFSGSTKFNDIVAAATGMPTDLIGQNLWKAAHNVSGGTVTIDTTVEGSYTIDGKSVKDWAADYTENIEQRVKTLTEQISANEIIIKNLEQLKGLDLKSIYNTNHSSSGSNKNKDVEEYVADIDAYREAIERLNRIQIRRSDLETMLSNEGDLKRQIELQKELVDVYQEEQDALHVLNDLRDQTILNSSDALRAMGFEIEYDPDYNRFFVKNLEHINDLVADSKGKYDTLQEATNALRKETEGLINNLEELNEANQENSEQWTQLAYAIREATIAIYENILKERENTITLTENWLEAAVDKNETGKVKQYTTDIVAYYREMQRTLHDEAEYYRSIGYSDTSNEVSKLSDLWWEYENNIKEIKQNVVDYLSDIVSAANDMVDDIQNVFSVLKDAADEYADNGGFISVDTLQSIYGLGVQYMQYLEDENGLLIINEENINKVIAAKTRQLAAEQAMAYVERLRLALQTDSIENLNTLLFATTEATDATFGLAYAEIALMHTMGDLDDQQYAAALHNIQAIENLANTAIEGIGQTAGSARDQLDEMKSGIDDILKYVMDMLKHRIKQQIEALEDMKDAYADIISLRKEALDSAKKEAEYEDKVAAKVKEMAQLQAKINALSLDNSRDAQAKKAELEEQLAELQKELADEQNEYAVEAQKDALDDMQKAYEDEKDAEIKDLEDTISSYQKLYDMAIDYIQNHWDTLYSELIAWNTQYGNVLNSEITTAWENCLAAAQRYGSYVAALNSIDSDITAAGKGNSSSNNTIVGNSGTNTTSTDEDGIHAIIKEMYANSKEWITATDDRREWLNRRNLQLGSMLSMFGINAHREADGAWYLDDSGELLYNKYRKYVYHKGGVVGDDPGLKDKEVMAILEKGELVLDKQKEEGLYRLIDFTSAISDKLGTALSSIDLPGILDITKNGADGTHAPLPAVTNTQNDSIHFGDVYIYGASDETVRQHQEVTRKFTNEVLSYLRIKR